MNLKEAIMEAYKDGLVDEDFVIEKFGLFKKKKDKNKNLIDAEDMPGGQKIMNDLMKYTSNNIELPEYFRQFWLFFHYSESNGKKTASVVFKYKDAKKKDIILSGDKYNALKEHCAVMLLKFRDTLPEDKKFSTATMMYENHSAFLHADERVFGNFTVKGESK